MGGSESSAILDVVTSAESIHMATSVHVVTRCKNVHNKGTLTGEHTLPSAGVSDMVELTVDDAW